MEASCNNCDSIIYLSYLEVLQGCQCSECGHYIPPQETESKEEETEDSW